MLQKARVWVTMATHRCTMAWPVSVGGVDTLGDLDSEEMNGACWEMEARREDITQTRSMLQS